MWYMYTTEYYSAIKKNKIMPFALSSGKLEISREHSAQIWAQ